LRVIDREDHDERVRLLAFKDSKEILQESEVDRFLSLVERIRQCHRCQELNVKEITESVPGFGNLHSKIVIIGQSPCRKCMETQIPFTGGSGRLLDRAFQKAGMNKSDVFITNVIHCHTPGNRKSLPHEIANCRGYLLEELQIIEPKAIIPLGRDAVVSILGQEAWPNLVGKRVPHGSHIVYPRHHPSYVMKLGHLAVESFIQSLAAVLKSEIR